MDVDYSRIGKLIKHRREKLDLTQAVLAERCDITEQYVSNIERAVSIPSTEVIMKLAAALDTTPDEFLVGSGRQPGGGLESCGRQAASAGQPAAGPGQQLY